MPVGRVYYRFKSARKMRRKLFLPAYFVMNTGKVLEWSFSKRMNVVGLNMFLGTLGIAFFGVNLKRLKAVKGERFS